MAVGLTSAMAIKSVAIPCNEYVSESTACQENEGNVVSGVKISQEVWFLASMKKE